MSEPLKKSWLEAGAILYFEKQPDRPFIPRRGESFTSIAVYKADDVDAKLAAETARADRAVAGCAVLHEAVRLANYALEHMPGFTLDDVTHDMAVAMDACHRALSRDFYNPGQRYLDLAQIAEGFDKREGEIVVMSTDTLGVHHDWDVRHEYRQSDGTFVSMRIAIFQHQTDADALARLLAWRQGSP